MENVQNQSQPEASSIPTDYNDLHRLRGLEEVARQINFAISNYNHNFPTPLLKSDSQNQGSNEEDSHLGTGEQKSLVVKKGEGGNISTENTMTDDEQLLQKHLSRFCLIESETNIWDSYGKKIWKKTAFVTLLGSKKKFDEWNNHDHRKTITRDDVDGLVDEGSNRIAKQMMDRFIMLEGKKACWDTFRRELVSTDVMKDNWSSAFKLWIANDDKRMIWHEDLVFKPDMNIKEGQINTFDGMEITPLLDENNEMMALSDAYEYCVPILNLLKFLCGKETAAYDWIIKWLAYPLQNAGAKLDTSILMCSKVQGSGKSIFFEKIMGRIYGHKYSVTLGQNGLEGIYTDWAERKLYCLFEEVFNNKSKYGMMGLIKHMITGEKIRIEKKFMSGYSQNNHINCVFLSNEIQPLAIEEQDRRFCVLAPDQVLDDSVKKQMGMYIDDPELFVIRALYTYFLRLDLNDFDAHSPPPMTRAKNEIIHYGLPSWRLFLDDWRGNFLDYPYVCCLSDDLYIAYRSWCHKNGEKSIPSNKFLSLIATEKYINKGHGRIWEDTFKTGYSDSRKEVQRRIVFVTNQPKDVKQADWLTSQVKLFRAKVPGENDVPQVL